MGEKRGQSWSVDLILAAAVFILVISAFYAFVSRPEADKQTDLQNQAAKITDRLNAKSGGENRIIIDGKIDSDKMAQLAQTDYEELKKIFGVNKDFCIYLEDENGRLIPINGTYTGIGGDQISINGVACNTTVS